MKLQNVILKAIAKKITWLDAAEIAGINARTMVRLKQKYEEFGYDGLYDQRRRTRHIHRVPLGTAEKVLILYQEKYSGASVWSFYRKLRAEQGIQVNYSWVKQALEGAGLAPLPHKRGPARPRRRPRPATAH